jgi:hypothetical protein
VEGAHAAEEGWVGDDAVEGGAGASGPAEVGEGREADQDGREDVVGEDLHRRRWGLREAPIWPRRQGHR